MTTPHHSNKPLHSGDTVTVTSKEQASKEPGAKSSEPETPAKLSYATKPVAKAFAPEPKQLSPQDQLVAALNAFINAATGKISPGNAVWSQAQAAITSATRKPGA